jgi:hypothetical protein
MAAGGSSHSNRAGSVSVSGLTAGVEFHASSQIDWVGKELEAVLAGAPQNAHSFGTVRLDVESATGGFSTVGMTRFSRDVYGDGKGNALVRNAAESGFDLQIRVTGIQTRISARWRPGKQEQVLSRVMKARQRLLLAQSLVHYPALWQASQSSSNDVGAVPVGACVLNVEGKGVLLTGPSGVGKSTLVGQELAAGAIAVTDNLAVVGTNRLAHGVVEPIRADFALLPPGIATQMPGRKTTHGRGEGHLNDREDSIGVDAVVLLRRTGAEPGVARVDAELAARELAAATYTAGEMKRYWPLAAALAVATGRGPVHPPITETTRRICEAVPCLELELGSAPGARLRELIHQTFLSDDLESATSWT